MSARSELEYWREVREARAPKDPWKGYEDWLWWKRNREQDERNARRAVEWAERLRWMGRG